MSLKCMIGKWLHKGQISQEEYDAVIEKLEGHDAQIRAKAYQQGNADGIDMCIALFKEYQPRLATHVSEFGDRLEQLKGVE